MSISTDADALVIVYETIMDKMTGSEKEQMEVKFNELDQLIESNSDEKYQLEALAEIDAHLKAIAEA